MLYILSDTDKERIKRIILDSVNTFCQDKKYSNKIASIEGVITATLDDGNKLLIDMKETDSKKNIILEQRSTEMMESSVKSPTGNFYYNIEMLDLHPFELKGECEESTEEAKENMDDVASRRVIRRRRSGR